MNRFAIVAAILIFLFALPTTSAQSGATFCGPLTFTPTANPGTGSVSPYSVYLDAQIFNNSTQPQPFSISLASYSFTSSDTLKLIGEYNVTKTSSGSSTIPPSVGPGGSISTAHVVTPFENPAGGFVQGMTYQLTATLFMSGVQQGPVFTWQFQGPYVYDGPTVGPSKACSSPSYYLLIVILAITFTFLLAAKRPKTGPQ